MGLEYFQPGRTAQLPACRIRDPIHAFIELRGHEVKLLDSRPFQRLRHLHQLATTFLVYPSATHRRFEHSLGVMDLADKIYSVITQHLPQQLKETYLSNPNDVEHWRQIVRLAALCHDLGHLPFSHGAEDLLAGKTHEDLSWDVINSDLADIWSRWSYKLDAEAIGKLALGKEKLNHLEFTPWEEILSEVITGDCFGADRMDYLLRDSYHLGVSYGRFDHHRLIESLRILTPPGIPGGEAAHSFQLGIELGGLQSAEGLVLARYLMFSQVYYHKTRLILDHHLREFIEAWLKSRGTITPEILLGLSDNEVLAALEEARKTPAHAGHDPAKKLLERRHFRQVYLKNPADQAMNEQAFDIIVAALEKQFPGMIHSECNKPKAPRDPIFPVQVKNGESTTSSIALSEVLAKIPGTRYSYIYAAPDKRVEVEKWLKDNKLTLLAA